MIYRKTKKPDLSFFQAIFTPKRVNMEKSLDGNAQESREYYP